MTIFSLEIHVDTRRDLCPDPEFDNISVVTYAINNDVPDESDVQQNINGVIIIQKAIGTSTDANDMKQKLLNKSAISGQLEISYVWDEKDMFVKLVEILHK